MYWIYDSFVEYMLFKIILYYILDYNLVVGIYNEIFNLKNL